MPIVSPSSPPVPTPGLTQASLDFIMQALILCGSQAAGEPVSAEDAQSGLGSLNQMMDTWNAMELMIFTIQRLIFNLNANQQTYACGSGGDFNIPRPPRIERYGCILPSQIEYPAHKLTLKEWAELPIGKTGTQPLPAPIAFAVWDDNGFPLRLLNYWPVPSTGMQATIYPWIALSYFPDLVTPFTFPPAYAEAIKYNLAMRFLLEFPGDMQRLPGIKLIADQGMDLIKSFNTEVKDLDTDLHLLNGKAPYYNFYSDTPAGTGRG